LRIKPIICLAGFLVLFGACKGMKGMLSLQKGLVTEFQWGQIGVNINNGSYLTVTFQNAPFASESPEQRSVICRRAAEYVRDHYSGYAALSTVAVAFASRQDYGPLNVTHSQRPCTYSTSKLGTPAASAGAGRP
jgi:hypothetical protein